MQPGDLIKDFTLDDQDGNPIALSQYSGSLVVLFFYPRADTPGCTVEVCAFRDIYKKLKSAGAVVFGISRDTAKAQKKFQYKFDLPYTLLADPDMAICNYFDVVRDKNMYGKKVKGVERTTFLIGPDRTLLHIFSKVTPETHPEEVLAFLRK